LSKRVHYTSIKNQYIFSVFPNENFVDLGLYQFGWEQCKPSHSFGPASRNHYLFHYVISGTGRLYADDSKGITQIYSIKSMQGFMIFPDQVTTYISDNDMPWEYVWVEFDGLRVKQAIEAAGLSKDNPVYHARYKDLREQMVSEMLYIANHKDMSSFHLIGHLYLFLDYLTRSAAAETLSGGSKLRDFYIHEAINFIEHNFQNNISVEDIASVCGLNRSYFGKIFKLATGKTPQDFLMNYRMIKATELLKLTDLSIGDISNAVGYENQMHFSRAFKNIYDVSPRTWRNLNRIKRQI
jgi:AraC-like DNA-binding protein